MTDLLFVYGTLLRSVPGSRNHLLGPAKFLGKARCAGRLVSVGSYPGAIPSTQSTSFIHGELYRLEDPETSLRQLDRYEGFVPGSPEGCEFVRSTASVEDAQGLPHTAWIYFYGLPSDALPELPGGDYAASLPS